MSETQRCSRKDWLAAGMKMLTKHGHEALGVSRLAETLGVTKGSFYWHFRNVGEFQDALLELWHKRYIRIAAQDAKRGAANTHPLNKLISVLTDRNMPAYDVAIRHWAKVNPKAALAIRGSERFRRELIIEMLCSRGVDQKTAEAQAQLVIWVWQGSHDEPNPRWRQKVMSELFRLLTADQT